MNCRKCGAIVPDGSTSCNVCGAPIAPAAPQYAQGGNYGAAPVRPRVQTAAPAPAPAQRCPQCGGELAPNARFCGNCGASFAGAPVSPRPVAPKPVAKGNFLSKVTSFLTNGPSFTVAGKTLPVYGAVAAGVALVLVIVLLFSIFGGNSPEAAAEKFVDAMFEGDAGEIMDLIPDELLEYMADEEDLDMDEMEENLQDGLDDMQEYYEEYDIEYKGCEVKKVKDMKKSQFRDLQDEYEDEFDMEVEDAKIVKVKVTIEQDGDKDSNTMEIIVIKVGGSYYVDMSSLDSIF